MAKSPTAVVSESTKGTTDERKPSMHANYSSYGQKSLFIPLKLFFTHLHNVSSSKVNHEGRFLKSGTYVGPTVYNVSQHYINDASTCASLPRARAFIRKTWPWGKLLQKSWGTLIQYGKRNKCIQSTRITLKSKYVTIHGVNRFNSLKVKLRNSVSSGITIFLVSN